MRSRWMARTVMSAGVMPEMRRAWPRERGVNWVSLDLASLRRPVIVE